MFREGARKDVNIVKINKDAGHFDIAQDIIHGPLKSDQGITEALGHPSRFKEAFSRDKGTFFSVFRGQFDLPIAAVKVYIREIFKSTNHKERFMNAR